jgi:hypothetical protein
LFIDDVECSSIATFISRYTTRRRSEEVINLETTRTRRFTHRDCQ